MGVQFLSETVRRLTCDAALITAVEDSAGKVLNVGRKTRAIPPSIRRALSIRDQGCRVPGCCESRYVDAHHVQHWCDGGETSLDNLVLLCRHHHRLLHQGAFRIERTSGRQGSARISRIEFIFRRPDGQEIRRSLYPQFEQPKIGRDGALAIEGQHRALGLEIDAGTAITAWQGERMDYDTAVGAMWAR